MYGNTLIWDAFWISNKPFPTAQSTNSGHGKVFHDYYPGNARYLGWMDLVLLKDIIKKHHINHIILQNLDTLGKITKVTRDVKVCIAYEHNKFIIRTALQEKELVHCNPIYETVEFGGWELSEDDYDFPPRAKHYIRYLLIHTRVDYITCMTKKVKLTARFNILGNVVFETEPNL